MSMRCERAIASEPTVAGTGGAKLPGWKFIAKFRVVCLLAALTLVPLDATTVAHAQTPAGPDAVQTEARKYIDNYGLRATNMNCNLAASQHGHIMDRIVCTPKDDGQFSMLRQCAVEARRGRCGQECAHGSDQHQHQNAADRDQVGIEDASADTRAS